MKSLLGLYSELSKARLSLLVLFTTFTGYFLATPEIQIAKLLWILLGTGLCACGANGLNQWYEIDHDAQMDRTKNRPLPSHRMSPTHALLWSLFASFTGVLILWQQVNPLTSMLGMATILLYVCVYTPLKTYSSLCTLIGAICGAIPPMMGWTGATGQIDLGTWILALLLFFWQIPHFLSLGWLYREDYARGGFQILPVLDRTGKLTCQLIILYSLALFPTALTMTLAGITGFWFACGSLLLGMVLFLQSIKFGRYRSRLLARKVFFTSIIYLPLLMGLMLIDKQPFELFSTTEQKLVQNPAHPLSSGG